MNKVILLGLGLIGSSICYAGDVMYTMWQDDESQMWVTIQNEMDRTILIESISIVFYDQKGKPSKEQQEYCQKNCKLRPRDQSDYGPYSLPNDCQSSRVRYVKFSVE